MDTCCAYTNNLVWGVHGHMWGLPSPREHALEQAHSDVADSSVK